MPDPALTTAIKRICWALSPQRLCDMSLCHYTRPENVPQVAHPTASSEQRGECFTARREMAQLDNIAKLAELGIEAPVAIAAAAGGLFIDRDLEKALHRREIGCKAISERRSLDQRLSRRTELPEIIFRPKLGLRRKIVGDSLRRKQKIGTDVEWS
ncbi:hypothetical protein [Paracoccus ravus]|uniref:hypothetical protein n=1 Tax=Paracoccus ravus TaxID=2447760 RepID=UPI00106EDC55|nr:hypothetical protein [Paracoccus ravus]